MPAQGQAVENHCVLPAEWNTGCLSFPDTELPYIMRLLYPFDKIDLFHVAWKIPREYLVEDSARIKVWGRCLYDVELLNLSPVQWIPYWWSGQERYEQLLLGSVLAGTLLLGVQAIYGRIRRTQIA